MNERAIEHRQEKKCSKQGFACPRPSECRDYGSEYPVQHKWYNNLLPICAAIAIVASIVVLSMALIPRAVDKLDTISRALSGEVRK